MGNVVTSNNSKEDKHQKDGAKPLACATNEGNKVVVYRGGLMLYLYDVVESGGERDLKRKELFDLRKEI